MQKVNNLPDRNLITGETKELTLVHLLECSKKHRIKEIAARYGIKLSDKSTKQQMIELLLPAVEVQSGIRIKHYSRDELRIIMYCLTECELPAEKIEDVTQSAPFRDGVIYITTRKDSVFTYVPHDFAGKSMMRCITECADSKNDELQKCAAACSALYGCFSPELFCKAAGNAYGLKVTLSQAESFLASDNSGLFSYNNRMASANTGTQFVIRNEAEKLDYYLPTKNQADSYATFGADTSDYYYRQITNFFYNNTGISYDDARTLIKRIAIGCAADENPLNLFEEVRQSGAVMNTDQYCFVTGMIGELFNRSRKHSLKGHLPDEVDGFIPVRIPSVMAFPAKPEPVRAEEKIGRNDPCPCGSGKKYKKCCGKNL